MSNLLWYKSGTWENQNHTDLKHFQNPTANLISSEHVCVIEISQSALRKYRSRTFIFAFDPRGWGISYNGLH